MASWKGTRRLGDLSGLHMGFVQSRKELNSCLDSNL